MRAEFEAAGFTDVATYIQIGNVVFSAPSTPKAKLTLSIANPLDRAFACESRVVHVSAEELACVIDEAPPKFGSEPQRYRYDVLFVKAPLTTREAFQSVTTNPDVDAASAGKHALHFRRLIAKASKSHLAKIMGKSVYRSLTIRNDANPTPRVLVGRQPSAHARRGGRAPRAIDLSRWRGRSAKVVALEGVAAGPWDAP